MPPLRRDPDAGRRAVTFLATLLLVLLGAIGCVVIVMTSESNPRPVLIVAACLFSGLGFALFRMQVRPERTLFAATWAWFAGKREMKTKTVLQLRRRKHASGLPLGGQAPPSADDLQTARDLHVRWVPKGNGNGQS